MLTSSRQVSAVWIRTIGGFFGTVPQGPYTYETHTLMVGGIRYIVIVVCMGGTPVRRLVIRAEDAHILDDLRVDDPLSSTKFTDSWGGQSWATYAADPSTDYVTIKPGSKCPVLAAVKSATDEPTEHDSPVDTDGECSDCEFALPEHDFPVDTDGEVTDYELDDEFDDNEYSGKTHMHPPVLYVERVAASPVLRASAIPTTNGIAMRCVWAPGAERSFGTYIYDDKLALPRTITVGDTTYTTYGMSPGNGEVFVKARGDRAV